MPLVTLLSDFGHQDPFVGVMRGVMACVDPRLPVVDLCHGIEPGDVVAGAFWLAKSAPYFPPGTVHVAVVDPGVGTSRRAIAARAGGSFFVGPDNGLLALAIAGDAGAEVRQIDELSYGRPGGSRTFHGRDLFAPVGAMLALGRVTFDALGPRVSDPIATPLQPPIVTEGGARGSVITFDRFGNILTDLPGELLLGHERARVRIAGRELSVRGTYGDGAPGEMFALVNSFGVLEIAARGASAAQRLTVRRGAPVELERR